MLVIILATTKSIPQIHNNYIAMIVADAYYTVCHLKDVQVSYINKSHTISNQKKY